MSGQKAAPPGGATRLNAHRRLLVGLVLLCAAFLVQPAGVPLALRLALSWDVAVVSFLATTWWVIRQCPRQYTRQTVLANDQGRAGVLALVLAAIAASVAAIFFLLERAKSGTGPSAAQVIAAAATIVCSWVLTHVMFALHYAHRFYRDDPGTPEDDATGGLGFPGGKPPDYWDFLYFSFVIGMTSQVSDVQVTSPGMRRLVMWHGLLSFAFYTIILALSINIVAGMV